jgi:hypothetical protein
MRNIMFPEYWVAFLAKHGLEGVMVEIAEEHDRSEVGVSLAFLTLEQSVDEATRFWPGMKVTKDGYVPVGACCVGSGDYYYIRGSEGPGGPLYRIYHDAVYEEGYDPDDAIALVLRHYEELLGYVDRG